jgi:ribosomal protein S18 acetylase RimI-like enzyme
MHTALPATDWVIGAAALDDAYAIAEIHVAGWHAFRGLVPDTLLDDLSVEKRETGWRAAIERGEPRILVARHADRILGWIAFGKRRDTDQPGDSGEIWALFTHPEHWSCGVGTSLWTAAREALRAAGFARVTLRVLRGNERARRFYESAFFAEDASPYEPRVVAGALLDEVTS